MFSFRDSIYTYYPLNDFKFIVQDINWIVIRAKFSDSYCKIYRKKYINNEAYFDAPDKVIRNIWGMFK